MLDCYIARSQVCLIVRDRSGPPTALMLRILNFDGWTALLVRLVLYNRPSPSTIVGVVSALYHNIGPDSIREAVRGFERINLVPLTTLLTHWAELFVVEAITDALHTKDMRTRFYYPRTYRNG